MRELILLEEEAKLTFRQCDRLLRELSKTRTELESKIDCLKIKTNRLKKDITNLKNDNVKEEEKFSRFFEAEKHIDKILKKCEKYLKEDIELD